MTNLCFKELIRDVQTTLSAAFLDHKFSMKPTIFRHELDQRSEIEIFWTFFLPILEPNDKFKASNIKFHVVCVTDLRVKVASDWQH